MPSNEFITPLRSEQLGESRVNPNKRNPAIQWLAHDAPWWLLIILGSVLFFAISVQDSRTYREVWGEVRQGIWTTIWVSVVAYSLALMLGLTMTLLRRKTDSVLYNFLVYQPVSAIVETVRGIPTLVLVFYVTLALVPQLVNVVNDFGENLLQDGHTLLGLAQSMADITTRDIPNPVRAIIALALSYSAFLSEIFRAGIESINYGQNEAAHSLGMSRWQVMRHIILPQAIRNILPPLGNDFIAILKESSLVSVVGVEDITRQGQTYATGTFTYFEAYNVIALTYLVLTLALASMVRLMEAWLDRGKSRES